MIPPDNTLTIIIACALILTCVGFMAYWAVKGLIDMRKLFKETHERGYDPNERY
jgi:hypothetical protein